MHPPLELVRPTNSRPGHASREDLKEFIRKVEPDILIPVHTLDAEGFRDFHKNVRMPEKGGTIRL